MDSKAVKEETEVPVIDLAPLLDSRGSSEVRTAKLLILGKIRKACEEWGFFQVINHGLRAELIEEALATSRRFFEYRAQAGAGDPPQIPTGYNVWFQFRLANEKVLELLSNTAEFIESLVSQSLGFPASFLRELSRYRIEPFKVLCYPRATSPHEEIGAREHQDCSCITLVGQDETGGYQVLKDQKWVHIKPIKAALVVNIGDVIQIWSNNTFKSVVHRVVNSKERRRCSFVYGSLPNPNMIMRPLPQFTTDANCPAAYTPFVYRDYIEMRIHEETDSPANPESFLIIQRRFFP